MNELRAEATEAFCTLTGLPDIQRVIQRGRDPQTARFTFELTDNTKITIGTIETLWSQAKLGKVMAVAAGHIVRPCKPNDWRNAIGALILHATDVEETPDETLEATVRDWLDLYIAGEALNDKEGAIALRYPYVEDGALHISADHFARWIRREYSEHVHTHELRQALGDLGFQPTKVTYTVRGTGKQRERTSARYYAAPLAIIEQDAPQP